MEELQGLNVGGSAQVFLSPIINTMKPNKGVTMSMDKKQEKFENLAERRVTEAIHRIWIIGNLSNTVNYL